VTGGKSRRGSAVAWGERNMANAGNAGCPAGRLPAPLIFLKRWAANPRAVGSIAPSGIGLRRLFQKHTHCGPDEVLVEFGGGTGAITRAFLDMGVAPERLYTFEIDDELAAYLRETLPGVHVVHGDCREAFGRIPVEDRARIGALVVTLPMLVLPMDVQKGVIDVIFRLLPPGGRFLMFTYSLFAPLDAMALGVRGTRLGWTPFNIPPATVWAYSKA
jgi:phosphatidylethanolamine/phosphatidyl-N-methylethanolamine N-methyltransferase